jgi:NADH-quinone oxidoreductase subunit B
MDIQEKVRNEYSVVQDYTEGAPARHAPIIGENAQYPAQLEKPRMAWQDELEDADIRVPQRA